MPWRNNAHMLDAVLQDLRIYKGEPEGIGATTPAVCANARAVDRAPGFHLANALGKNPFIERAALIDPATILSPHLIPDS